MPMLIMRCYKYPQIDNVLTLQNITEHYTLKAEHCLFINALIQNIVSPRTNTFGSPLPVQLVSRKVSPRTNILPHTNRQK